MKIGNMTRTTDNKIVVYEVHQKGSGSYYVTHDPAALGEFLELLFDASPFDSEVVVKSNFLTDDEYETICENEFDGF